MMSIRERIETIRRIINTPVRLIAVSKTRTAEEIREAFEAGVTDFGENYLQEALPKITLLQDLPLTWHFIGKIQHNKAKQITTHFNWVHSVCSERVAQQLNDARPNHLPSLNICLQVNIDREPTKSGVLPEAIGTLVNYCLTLPRLQLRGLMIIPKPGTLQHDDNPFLKTATLLTQLNKKHHLHLDTLSMGMSDDFHAAIQAGSTCIRIGTRIFGARKS